MTVHRSRLLVISLLAFATPVAIGGAVAAAVAPHAAPRAITPAGVGVVKVGKTYASLRAAHAVGKLARGCELQGPGARTAPLRAPLKGFVELSQSSPRRVTNITIRGGATARGIRVGAKQSKIRRAFPKAIVDHSTESRFDVTLFRIPKGGGGPLQFSVVSMTKTVTAIGIPQITFCE